MSTQACPACGTLHDVGIYTTGKRLRCRNCGLHFTVRRPASMIAAPQRSLRVRGGRSRAGAAAVAAPAPATDTTPVQAELSIPGFEIKELLGKGGMGRVYRARQISLDRWVAIKVLNEDLARHHSFIRRFEKESGALAALNHPNITAIFDRGCAGGHYYFVMEYVGGPSLRVLMQRGLGDTQAVRHFCVLCRAVAHAHKRSVIHRDLKPENVLFTDEGVLKVADFGLANIIAPDRRWELTRTRVSMGTVNYMAPEQRHDAKHVDHRADLYSLGVILYEMLTGELPVGRFRPPSQLRPGCDPRLDRVVMRLLDSDPGARPASADLVAATLETWLAERRGGESSAPGRAVSATTTRPRSAARPKAARPGKLRRFITRTFAGRLAWWLAALGVALAAGLLVLWLLLREGMSGATGDLRLTRGPQGQALEMVHPRQLTYLAPSAVHGAGGARGAEFDFLPSAREPIPVRLVGGTWLKQRGLLVQDTCAHGLTINQVPARGLFGPKAVAPEGLRLELEMRVGPTFLQDSQGRRLDMANYLKMVLGSSRLLLPVNSSSTAGMGFVDEQGRGLEVLLPVDGSRTGWLLRHGADMEGGPREFSIPAGLTNPQQPWQLSLAVNQGRVSMRLGKTQLVDELAGFPLGFKGFPAVSCQNARCELRRLSYRLVPAR